MLSSKHVFVLVIGSLFSLLSVYLHVQPNTLNNQNDQHDQLVGYTRQQERSRYANISGSFPIGTIYVTDTKTFRQRTILLRNVLDLPSKQYPFKYIKAQNFPIHDVYLQVGHVNVSNLPVSWEGIVKHLNNTWVADMRHAQEHDRHFKPSMTLLERQRMLYTMDIFMEICDRMDITFFLSGGSMLGVYRHHGMIPWDDDIDVAVNASDWKKLRHALTQVPGFTLYAPSVPQWKFYLSGIPRTTTSFPFRWPFIDIFFFAENAERVWGITTLLNMQVNHKKTDVFPLMYRPFENTWAPIPRKPLSFLQGRMDPSTCVSLWYDHKRESATSSTTIQCSELSSTFPFVTRRNDSPSRVIETLSVGDRIIHSAVLPSYLET